MLAQQRVIGQPGGGSVGAELIANLQDPRWLTFRGVVAFAKSSGVKHIAFDLRDFATRTGSDVRFTVGISGQGTSLEGLQDLWRVLDGVGRLFVYEEGLPHSIFHPKTYFFRNVDQALVIAGSNNLTEGGLFNNHELSTVTELNLNDSDDAAVAHGFETALDLWQAPSASCLVVDPALLQKLHDQGDLPGELASRVARRQASAALRATKAPSGSSPSVVFGPSGHVTKAPPPKAFPSGLPPGPVVPTPPPISGSGGPAPTPTTPAPSTRSSPPVAQASAGTAHSALLMEVRPHHNGEVFLSYRAVAEDPGFFGHPFAGWSTPRSRGAKAYPMASPDPIVEILVYDAAGAVLKHKPVHSLNVVDYVRKHEIRITVPDGLQHHIPAMSLLVMTKDPTPALQFRLEFFPPGAPQLSAHAPSLTQTLPSGGAGVGRRYGWI